MKGNAVRKEYPDGSVDVDVSTKNHAGIVCRMDRVDQERLFEMQATRRIGTMFAVRDKNGRFFVRTTGMDGAKNTTVQVAHLICPNLPRVRFISGESLDCRRENLGTRAPKHRQSVKHRAVPVSRKRRGGKTRQNDFHENPEDRNSYIVDVSTEKYPDAEMVIDKADWDRLRPLLGRVAAHNFGNRPSPRSYFLNIRAHFLNKGKIRDNRQFMHRLLMPDAGMVKFRNGKALDVRRSNMFPVGGHGDQRKKGLPVPGRNLAAPVRNRRRLCP